MGNFELAVVFCTLFGIATLVSFAALAGRIKFSLRTIFIIVTTSCIGFALFSALGDGIFRFVFVTLVVMAPIGNILVVATLFVLVVNSAGRRQAIRIGWLTPLVGMAVIDCVRIAFAGPDSFLGAYLIYYPLVYFTAWIGGLVCERTYHSNRVREPMRGPGRRAVLRGGRSAAPSQAKNPPKPKVSVPSPFSKAASHPLDDEPNVYEIN